MNGRSVLYVPCIADQKRRFRQAISANELSGQVLDVSDERCNDSIDHQLIAAVGFQPGVASSRFDQIADELVGVRSRLTRYLGACTALTNSGACPRTRPYRTSPKSPRCPRIPPPECGCARRPRVRSAVIWMNGRRSSGVPASSANSRSADTAWFKASITSEDEAVTVYQRVVDLLRKLLPLTREQVSSTVQTCGFPIPNTEQEWCRQVQVLKNLRRVLDVFQPEIFERDIDAMIESSKSKAERKAEGTTIGFWERRRHIKEAKSLLRVGAQVENLARCAAGRGQAGRAMAHVRASRRVAGAAEQTRRHHRHAGGAGPRPDGAGRRMSTTVQGGDLESQDFVAVEERLKALFDDHLALDTLPERCRLEHEFQTAGLTELVEDAHAPCAGGIGGCRTAAGMVGRVFENIVRASAIISNQDGSALQSAADRFAQVDTEHVRSVGSMVAQESMRRLCEMLFSRTQESNQLHTVLAGKTRIPLSRIRRDHPEILAAAKPIIVATPATLAALTDPTTLADVAIIDAAAHIPAIQLLTIVCRAKQVAVLAHRFTVTSPSVKALMELLPSVKVRSPRAARAQARRVPGIPGVWRGAL